MLYNLRKGKEALGLHKQEPAWSLQKLEKKGRRTIYQAGETGGLLNLDWQLLIRR